MICSHSALVEKVNDFAAGSLSSHEAGQPVQQLCDRCGSHSGCESDDSGCVTLQLRGVSLAAQFFRLGRIAALNDLRADPFGSNPATAKEAC